MGDTTRTDGQSVLAAQIALLEAIEAVGDASDDGLSGDDGLDAGLDRLVAGLDLSLGAVYVKRPTSGVLELRAWRGERPPTAKIIDLAAQSDLYTELLDGSARVLRDELAKSSLGTEVAVVAPLRAGAETLGALLVAPHAGAELHRDTVSAVGGAARVLGLGLSNAQLFRGLQDRAREMDRQVRQLVALTEVARAVARWLEPDEVRATVVAEARRLVRAEGAALVLPDDNGELNIAASETAEAAPPSEALAGARRILHQGGMLADGGVAGLPVNIGEDRVGALIVWRSSERPFEADDTERLRGLADQATVALTNAQLLADLAREQRERQRLAARIVETQENERRRIAEDIHDGPVQELVGLGLLLDALAAESSESKEAAQRAATSARDTVRTLRQAIFDLHPMSLQELGFTAATRTLCERHSWRGIEYHLDLAAADALDDTQRTVAFRIVQEAVANAAQHANAMTLWLGARSEDGSVIVEVRDDGAGFDPTLANSSRIEEGHVGLAAMRERAHLAGGELHIDTTPGEGTTVRLTVPAPASS